MRLGVKYIASLMLVTSLAACQSDEAVTDASGVALVGPSHVAYSPGDASYTLSVTANTVVAGSDVTLRITSVDSHGNPYSAGVNSIQFSTSGGVATGTIGTIKPKGNGIFEASFTGNVAGSATTVSAVVNGSVIPSTVNIAVTTGEAKFLTVIEGDHQAARVGDPLPINPKVKVTDKYGNAIAGATVNFTVSGLTPGTSTLSGPVNTTENRISDSNGIVTIPWVMGTSTGQTDLVATTLITAGSVSVTLTATCYDKPSTPNLYITGVNNKVDLAWTLASIGASSVKYRLYRSLNPNSNFFLIASNTANTLFSDVDATSGVYYYYLIADNGYIDSDPSPVVSNEITITQLWTMLTANASNFITNSNLVSPPFATIQFANDVCSLTPSNQTDNSTSGFGSGTNVGTNVSGTVLKLANNGSCDSTQTDCVTDDELSSAWLSKYPNLGGYWKMNGTVGGIANNASIGATVGSNGLALNAGSSGMAYSAAGKVFQGINFDGVDDGIKVTDYAGINFATGNKYSVSFWYKPASIGGLKYIFDKQQTGSKGYYAYRNGSTLYFGFPNGSAWNELNSGSVLAVGNWYHVVATHNGTSQQIYVNGYLKATRTLTLSLVNSTTDLYIGRGISAGYNDPSVIDEFALFNVDLTAADVLNIYNKQMSRKAGVFTSRVMDGLTTIASWTKLNWSTTIPFGKALPDYSSGIQYENQAPNTTDYPSVTGPDNTTFIGPSNNLMQGIVGLWHFDETSGSTFADTSGAGNTNSVPAGAINFTTGRFGGALDFNGSTFISVPYKASRNLATAWTVQAWIRQSVTPAGYQQIITDEYLGGKIQFHLGYMGNGLMYAGSYNGAWYNSPGYAVKNGEWTHLVGVYYGAQGQMSLYANGVLVGTTTGVPSSFATQGSTTRIGRRYDSAEYYTGAIDEVAIWNRPLTSQEVLQLYRRGANRVKFQVRTCALSSCSDGTWKGPNGTTTYFSEFYNKTTQAVNPSGGQKVIAPSMPFSSFSSPVTNNKRYFQYRAILESDDLSTACSGSFCSPEVLGVTVDPIHYDTTSPTVVTKNSVPFTNVFKISEVLGPTCSSGISYNVSLDKTTWYYWNGSAWVVASGSVTQSNSATSLMGVGVIANFERLIGTGSVYVKAFLKSSGTSPCALTSIKLEGQ